MRKWGDLSTWVHHTALWHCWAMRRLWQNTSRLRLRVPDCNKNTLRSCFCCTTKSNHSPHGPCCAIQSSRAACHGPISFRDLNATVSARRFRTCRGSWSSPTVRSTAVRPTTTTARSTGPTISGGSAADSPASAWSATDELALLFLTVHGCAALVPSSCHESEPGMQARSPGMWE